MDKTSHPFLFKFNWYNTHVDDFMKNLISSTPKFIDRDIKVSCIVPAYNEGKRIGNVLDAISSHEFVDEIIVINDGSTDETQAVLNKRTDIKVIYFEKNRGKSHAVMHGLKSAKNDIIMTIDSDLIGLNKKDLTALMEPVLQGHVDKTMTLRKNSLLIFKMFNLDFISGERVFRKSLIDNMDDIGNLKSFQLEPFLNNIIVKKKLQLRSIKWHGVITPRKFVKMGFWKGNMGDLKMILQIISFLGIKGIIKQFISMHFLKK